MKFASIAPTTPAEHEVIELYRTGLSIAKIHDATDVPERRIKGLTKGIEKGKKPKTIVSKIVTPLTSATERVFTLARRRHGIRDYELRNIMHDEYGSTWDTLTGQYISNYDNDKLKRVRAKVRQRAIEEDCNVIFTTDWIDETDPRKSSEFLLNAGAGLASRLNEYVAEYMALHATRWDEDTNEARLAQVKQRYAVEAHLLKLAVKGYSPEPIERLLERTANLVDVLEGNLDTAIKPAIKFHGDGSTRKVSPAFYPEPSRHDAFLEFVQSQGWINEIASRFV